VRDDDGAHIVLRHGETALSYYDPTEALWSPDGRNLLVTVGAGSI
jgi:hypothetical protein